MHSVLIETVARLVRRGMVPPVFTSANLDGGDDTNARLMAEYRHPAILGSSGSGGAAGMAQAQAEMVSFQATCEPDAEWRSRYTELYEEYREIEEIVLKGRVGRCGL